MPTPILTTKIYLEFIDFLKRHTAIALTEATAYLIELRLSPLASQNGFDSVEELLIALFHTPSQQLTQQVIEAMTTNETLFFRDTAFFESLEHHVFPELLSKRSTQQKLKIWCGACSSGQEPYSVLMLLHERFPHILNWSLDFYASDLASQMVARSKKGLFSELEISRGLPPEMKAKYFAKMNNHWQIKPHLIDKIKFDVLNLIEPWPYMPAMDIVFLRNVLIYFEVPQKQVILQRVRHILKPDGYLFLGSSETTLNLDPHFQRVGVGKSEYYCLK